MLLIGNMVASFKHHVFEEMSETAFADLFTGRTYMIGNIHMHDRVTVVFMYHHG